MSSSLTASKVLLKNLTNGDTINVSSPTFSDGGMTAQFTFVSYVRGGIGGDYDPQINALQDIANV
jgi:hypothetical protein